MPPWSTHRAVGSLPPIQGAQENAEQNVKGSLPYLLLQEQGREECNAKLCCGCALMQAQEIDIFSSFQFFSPRRNQEVGTGQSMKQDRTSRKKGEKQDPLWDVVLCGEIPISQHPIKGACIQTLLNAFCCPRDAILLLQLVFAYIGHSSDVELEQEGERNDEVAVGSYEKKFADLLNKEMLRIHDFFKAKIGEAYLWAIFLFMGNIFPICSYLWAIFTYGLFMGNFFWQDLVLMLSVLWHFCRMRVLLTVGSY